METQGRFDEKFKSIVDCYEEQFSHGLDIGSSLAITYEGEMVVDIWAGTRDKAQSLRRLKECVRVFNQLTN